MTVHVLMPVFNRLDMTKNMICCIKHQEVDEPVNLIVVDDGSSDGTREYLQSLQTTTVLNGDGNLWWGGSVDLGFRYILPKTNPDDWVLLVNNDTQIKQDFIQSLLTTARKKSPSAVGSVIRNENEPHELMSIGTRIDAWWLLVHDIQKYMNNDFDNENNTDSVEVDALSGRGVLFPVSILIEIGGMRSKLLPHYLADYELSLRAKKAGCTLLVDLNAAVYSKNEFGNSNIASSLKEKLLAINSPFYLPAVITFWWGASSWLQRITLPFRLVFFIIFPGFRGARK